MSSNYRRHSRVQGVTYLGVDKCISLLADTLKISRGWSFREKWLEATVVFYLQFCGGQAGIISVMQIAHVTLKVALHLVIPTGNMCCWQQFWSGSESGSSSCGKISVKILLWERLPDSDPDQKCCQQHILPAGINKCKVTFSLDL